MKKLVVLLLVVAGGFIAWNYFIGVGPASAQDQELADLEARFQAAQQRFTQATRTAGMSGIDVTADFEAARLSVEDIEEDLERVMPDIASDTTRQRARKLQEEIKGFRSRLGG